MVIDKIFFKRLIGYFIFSPCLPFWWLQKLIKRKKNIWIFGSWHGTMYSDNSKALFEYVNQYHNEIMSLSENNNVIIEIIHLSKYLHHLW